MRYATFLRAATTGPSAISLSDSFPSRPCRAQPRESDDCEEERTTSSKDTRYYARRIVIVRRGAFNFVFNINQFTASSRALRRQNIISPSFMIAKTLCCRQLRCLRATPSTRPAVQLLHVFYSIGRVDDDDAVMAWLGAAPAQRRGNSSYIAKIDAISAQTRSWSILAPLPSTPLQTPPASFADGRTRRGTLLTTASRVKVQKVHARTSQLAIGPPRERIYMARIPTSFCAVSRRSYALSVYKQELSLPPGLTLSSSGLTLTYKYSSSLQLAGEGNNLNRQTRAREIASSVQAQGKIFTIARGPLACSASLAQLLVRRAAERRRRRNASASARHL
ncbi:unnamed protein product [Trichogramma brassicae]|uniref:Uncharacterized protein n=1 Tax=Trichogramma brassicae TaxID=86971 RepID=A0A6H5IGX5_9HYME|nr:unnamed protein product [Trichogramma brassicae]